MDMADALSLNYSRSIERSDMSPILKLLYKVEMSRMLKYESRAVHKFNRVFLHTAKDREYLIKKSENIKKDNIILSTQGVNFDLFGNRGRCSNVFFKRKRIVFVGTMSYLPNIQAVTFFVNEVFPSILKTFSDAEFYIVGSSPTAQVERLAKKPGVFVTGRVDNIYDYYAESTISVCPINIGAGIQNKILESMAVGVPVITSTMSSKGLLPGFENSLLIANSVDEWLDCIERLFSNFSFYEEKSDRAYRYVRENYEWDSVLEPYKQNINQLV